MNEKKMKPIKNNSITLYESSVFSFLSECSPGYCGLNCTFPCPYPVYGDRCQRICDCDKNSCDVSTGCRTPTTGYLSFNNITTSKHITFLSEETTNF